MRRIYKSFSQKIRRNILKRYRYTCQRCGRRFKAGERHLLTVHHGDKKPYCRPCHEAIEIEEMRRRREEVRMRRMWEFGFTR